MRTEVAATALLLAAFGAFPATAGGAEHPLRVEIQPPERLVEGDRAHVVARVFQEPPNDRPLLLTPSSEGTAVEVVRGRLLRADAEDPEAHPLVFRVPVVARSPGTAVLRVRVLAYVCDPLCREARAEQSATVRVHGSRSTDGASGLVRERDDSNAKTTTPTGKRRLQRQSDRFIVRASAGS
ncbi:MAG: hypothetical protein ACODAU_12725 [Myxococcota bacterium]